jgi:hypothetical protein
MRDEPFLISFSDQSTIISSDSTVLQQNQQIRAGGKIQLSRDTGGDCRQVNTSRHKSPKAGYDEDRRKRGYTVTIIL